MKAIAVSPRAKTLNVLLRKARTKPVILESRNGERFVVASVEGWEAFEVGKDDDITKNKKLMRHLISRRKGGKSIPLADVKRSLLS